MGTGRQADRGGPARGRRSGGGSAAGGPRQRARRARHLCVACVRFIRKVGAAWAGPGRRRAAPRG
eukprot:scaffold60285_cov60-Phaeocystis_antarctica.AAC.1